MGFKLPSDTPPLERELTYLLYDLCVQWGCCIPPDRAAEICRASDWSAKEFAAAMVEAERLGPMDARKWLRKIANKFRERFGAEEISESTFVDRVRGQTETW